MTKKRQAEVATDSTPFPFYGELGTLNLDSLTGAQFGLYQQSKSGNLYSGLNYPVPLSGSLLVLPTRDNGCSQEYRTYDSNALYRRRYFLGTFLWGWSPWCQEYNSENPAPVRDASVQGLSDAPAGLVALWPSATPPAGWLICDGSLFSTEEYPHLAVIFAQGKLPDLSVKELTPTPLRYITKAV